MALINLIKDMKERGMEEGEIIQSLKEQGYSPLEISQSIEQSNIKSAIFQEMPPETLPEMQEIANPPVQPGVIENENYQVQQPSALAQEFLPEQESYPQQNQELEAPQPLSQEEYAPQYPAYQSYPTTQTFTEIAEQITEEKINSLNSAMHELNSFKTIISRKVMRIDERLKRIESIIDSLQSSIIGKVANYGESINEIKNEMTMMQESFSKTLSQSKKPGEKVGTTNKKR